MVEAGAGVGAGARAEVQVSKRVLRICYKSFLKYLKTSIAVAKMIGTRRFAPEGLASCSEGSDSEGREES